MRVTWSWGSREGVTRGKHVLNLCLDAYSNKDTPGTSPRSLQGPESHNPPRIPRDAVSSLVSAPPPLSPSQPPFLSALSDSRFGSPHWLPTSPRCASPPPSNRTQPLSFPGLSAEPASMNGKACRTGAQTALIILSTRTKGGNSIMSPSTSERQRQFPL